MAQWAGDFAGHVSRNWDLLYMPYRIVKVGKDV